MLLGLTKETVTKKVHFGPYRFNGHYFILWYTTGVAFAAGLYE